MCHRDSGPCAISISPVPSATMPGQQSESTKYLTYEGWCSRWPSIGLYYDVSVFQVNVHDRIEAQQLTQTATIDVNTGNTRSRGVELESSYDVLHWWSDKSSGRRLDCSPTQVTWMPGSPAAACPVRLGRRQPTRPITSSRRP